jgi:two-component system CheB/CheR fusion protein
MTDYEDYRDRLESSAEEFSYLFNTVLINVTSFFRDIEAWSFLQREIIPGLIAETAAAEEIRVWSAGCSGGEEAYSLAIAFAERWASKNARNESRSTARTLTQRRCGMPGPGCTRPRRLKHSPPS